jgi:glycerol-3-phosphate dehydrogenase
MAEDVLESCAQAGLLDPRPAGATRSLRLVGAARMPDHPQPEPAARPAGKDNAPACHTVTPTIAQAPGPHLYGDEADVLARLPGAAHALAPGLTEAMVRFAARYEYALTVGDMLARRSRLLFLDARLAARVAPEVATILQQETGEDPQLESFLILSQQYLDLP